MQSSAADANPLPQTGKSRWVARLMFLGVLAGGPAYCTNQLVGEVAASEEAVQWLLLLIALLIALGFEFGNGFHDTANAVATVIYTRSLTPQVAVVWSGLWNFLSVMMASGAVAWGIVSLLPVELILRVKSSAGLAMVFALLIAAIVWNIGTWGLDFRSQPPRCFPRASRVQWWPIVRACRARPFVTSCWLGY